MPEPEQVEPEAAEFVARHLGPSDVPPRGLTPESPDWERDLIGRLCGAFRIRRDYIEGPKK